MGSEQSKTPYNVENPRRIRDLKTYQKSFQEYKALSNDNFDFQVFGNFTAPEFVTFTTMLLLRGIDTVVNNPERVKELNKNWKPWISIDNKWTEPIEAELYMNCPTRIMEGERITIQPGEIGRLPLPKEVDFNNECPLNPILNDRDVSFYYKNGQTMIVSCHLLNYGMGRGDFVFNRPNDIDACCEINEDKLPAPEQQAELRDFMAEANDPSCIALTDDQYNIIADFVEKCFPQAGDKQSK